MKRIFRRAAVAASSVGMVGGIVLTALPASADGTPVSSWGASATGPISFPPVAVASTFHTPGVASNANYTNILTTGPIVDRASATTGYSLVNSPIVQVGQMGGRADQISSWCHIGRSATFGGASIFNGSLSVNGSIVYSTPRYPAPNTTLTFGGATITLNKQQIVMGQLQVTAVYVHDGPETLRLGFSSCAADVG